METSLIGKALGFGPNECRFESCVSNLMPYDTNAYVTNHVNIALARKNLKSTIIYTKQAIKLINVLHRIGFLKNYVVLRKNNSFFIRFTIFFYKNTTYYHNIRLISTPSRRFFISLKALHKLKYATRSSVYILSTSKGLITHDEAILYKIGGLLLCAIN